MRGSQSGAAQKRLVKPGVAAQAAIERTIAGPREQMGFGRRRE